MLTRLLVRSIQPRCLLSSLISKCAECDEGYRSHKEKKIVLVLSGGLTTSEKASVYGD